VTKRAILAALLAPFAVAAADAPDGGRVVDEVVAVVATRGREARIVTRTKILEEGRIALVSSGGIEAAFSPLDGAVLRASLDWYVDQLLLHEEAVRLQVFDVDRADALAELARFKAGFATPGMFKAFLYEIDATEEDLTSSLRRTMRVRRYLESRLGRLRPSNDEVEAWYAAHAAEYGGRPLSEVTPEIVARLSAARADVETRALLADLRSRADIRILVDPSATP
jgi:hypothetical protein